MIGASLSRLMSDSRINSPFTTQSSNYKVVKEAIMSVIIAKIEPFHTHDYYWPIIRVLLVPTDVYEVIDICLINSLICTLNCCLVVCIV